MHENVMPAVNEGRYAEAEEVLDRLLVQLASEPGVDLESLAAASKESTPARDRSKFRRQTKETQYLVFTPRPFLPRGRDLIQELDEAAAKLTALVGENRAVSKRRAGFTFLIRSWDIDPVRLQPFLERVFDVAIARNVAVHLTVDTHEWDGRPDRWNYSDPKKAGYDPDNARNVEWTDWDGTPYPHRYRDWGRVERLAPVICYNCPAVLKEVSRIVEDVLAPPIANGLEALKKAGKEDLFAGITVGAEPDLPNYENVDRQSPRIARAIEEDGVPKARLGYNAFTRLGYSRENPPADFAAALAEVNRNYTSYWAERLHEAGISKAKMYTHVAAGAGVVGSALVGLSNAPIDIAFNDFSRPGWTTYPVGALADGFDLLYEKLAERGNPHWASAEANPSGLGGKAVPLQEYLSWHFDYGATLVVMNFGATSPGMENELKKGALGADASAAYKRWLTER
jgi:hypothetical protein